jgi:Fe-S-cluster containining protein
MSDEKENVAVDDGPIAVPDAMRAMYAEVDSLVAKALTKVTVSCKKGCHDCCKLLCCCTFAESILIADTLLRAEGDEWVKVWLPKLQAAAWAADYPEISNDSYFKKKIPCAFLKDGTCAIYDMRPGACRLHYVVTPPANCSPDVTKVDIQTPDFQNLEHSIWSVSKQVLDESFNGNTNLLAGPLALMVMASALVLLKEDRENHNMVLQSCKGLLTPNRWMERMIKNKEGKR